MKILFILSTLLILSACQTLPSTDPASIQFNIPRGSTLSLNKDLDIASSHTHVVIQDGKISTDQSKDLSRLSCSLEMKAFGPRTITPDVFQISQVTNASEASTGVYPYRQYTKIFLSSEHNSDIIKLECAVSSQREDMRFPVADIQKTLGDYFSFNFAKPTH